jgi:cytochrome c peroxidase
MRWTAAFALLLGVVALGARTAEDEVPISEALKRKALRHSPLPPPPPDPTNAYADSPAAAHLGQYLFFDERLSGNGEVSCATCHRPEASWADGKSLAEGIGRTSRNALSLWNVAHNRWLFWDGRADTLWSQALSPLEDPREHGGTRTRYARLVATDPDLRRAYEAIFGSLPDAEAVARYPEDARPVPDEPKHPHQLTWIMMSPDDREQVNRIFANIGKAIAAFERRLASRRAPFDVFVEGLRENDPEKQAALSPAARRGLELFDGKAGCRICHHGPMFSDLEFHNILVPPLDDELDLDPGRADGLTHLLNDRFNGMGPFSDETGGEVELKLGYLIEAPENFAAFKTPSLRNVARTAPYMHQGQFPDLRSVLEYYSTLEGAVEGHGHRERILQPLDLTDTEIADLIAFLESLTDETIAPSLTRQPSSPILPGR